jgi:hypothetical protein
MLAPAISDAISPIGLEIGQAVCYAQVCAFGVREGERDARRAQTRLEQEVSMRQPPAPTMNGLVAFGFVSALCVISLPAIGRGEPPSFRGLYVDAFHAGFKSAPQIDALVSYAVAHHYNAVLAQVLAYHDNSGLGHGAYWSSGLVPKASDFAGSVDPLAYIVERAQAVGQARSSRTTRWTRARPTCRTISSAS